MKNKSKEYKEFIKDVYASAKPKTAQDITELVKELTKDLFKEALDVELTNHLGYDRYEHTEAIKNNYRNGSYNKTLKTNSGEMEVEIPRDRNGTFKPNIVEKYQRDVNGFDEKIIALYSRGMSTRDISETINEIYGFEVDASTISKITDKILPSITEWQNRPLDSVYPFVFIDGIRMKIKTDNKIEERSIYIIMGYSEEGFKEVIGFWIGTNENSKEWLKVLNDLKQRGLNEIYLISCDNLPGISEAIKVAYPQAQIQKCIVHQIRNSYRYVNNIDIKEFMKDLKNIYKAPNESEALRFLDILDEKWGKKYPIVIKSWRDNFDELTTFFNFPPNCKKIIYTTNIIENLNRNIRKFVKTKSSFPTENAALKIVYFAIKEQHKKWGQKTANWPSVMNELHILMSK